MDEAPSSERIAVLLLAAGQSTRFGSHKLLARYRNKPLLSQIVDALSGFERKNLFAVTGHNAIGVEKQLSSINCIRFNGYKEGMGASISYGVNCMLNKIPELDHILIVLADQAAINKNDIEAFTKHYQKVCVGKEFAQTAVWDDSLSGRATTSPPAIFPRCYFDELCQLSGDRGAGDILKRAMAREKLVEYFLPNAAFDIDTPENLHDLMSIEALPQSGSE